MKKFISPFRFALLLIAGTVLLSSCRKKETDDITEEDAADAISYTLESDYGGLTTDISNAAAYAMDEGYGKTEGVTGATALQCGVPFDTSMAWSHTGVVTASYNHVWVATLNCNSNVPQSLGLTGTYTGSYSSSRMESTNSGTRNWSLTGLLPNAPAYTLNGSFVRNGSHTSKVRNQNTFTVVINTELTNVTVDKTTYRITGGTGTCTAVCSVSNGNSYNFNGSILFNGNNTATLTINGNTYTIQLY